MATPVIVGSILEVRSWSTLAEQAAVNSWHWIVTGITGAPPTDLDMAETVSDTIATAMKTILPTDATFNGIQSRVINVVPLPLMQVWVSGAGPGTDAGIAMGRQLAGLTSWQAGFAGPAFRGRSYWPFPCVDEDAVGGLPSAGYITNVTAISNALRTLTVLPGAGGGSATIVFGIYHRAARTVSPILNFQVQHKWATQKRRGSYGRSNVSPI